VGNFGRINDETGQFERVGNIYEDIEIQRLLPDISAPTKGAGISIEKIISKNGKTLAFEVGPQL
jgi:ABC-type enterochelin transport system substrate-binding protein